MRIRVVVYLRPKTVALLLSKKKAKLRMRGGQKWLADRLGVSETYVSLMMLGEHGSPVPANRESVIWDLFRGMSHKPGGRLTDADLFQRVTIEKDVEGSVTTA